MTEPDYKALVERLNATRTVFGDLSEADEALRLECVAAITALVRERDEARGALRLMLDAEPDRRERSVDIGYRKETEAIEALAREARAAALEEAAKVAEAHVAKWKNALEPWTSKRQHADDEVSVALQTVETRATKSPPPSAP